MTTSRGTYEMSEAGAYVQGESGAFNRVRIDTFAMIFIDESSPYAPPGDPTFGGAAYAADLLELRREREDHPERIVAGSVGWVRSADGTYALIAPPQFFPDSVPSNFTIRQLNRPPRLSSVQALFGAHREDFDKPFDLWVVVDSSGSMTMADLEPTISNFIDSLGDDSALSRLRLVGFGSERWIRTVTLILQG